MDSLSYSDFSLALHNEAVSRRVPVNGAIEVTRRCPMNCLHCYNNLAVDDQQARANELTYEEHCRILDQLSEAGCLWLLYTGGEIFVRGDFLDLYAYAKKKGLLIILFTNGTLITEEIADTLAQWRPFSIEISIYGRTRETFERITRVPGSYDRCMRGIRLLKERHLPLALKSMVLTVNRHEIGEMKKFAVDELGLEFRYDAMLNPRADGSKGPLRWRLTPEEIVGFDLQDPERGGEWKVQAARSKDLRLGDSCSRQLYQCGGGLTSFAIDPYGQMGVCMLARCGRGNLRRNAFKQIWSEQLLNVRQTKITKPSRCATCGIRSLCTMCPVSAELEEDDPEVPVDLFCRVAHLRAYALDIAVEPHGECDYCLGGREYQRMMDIATRLKRAGKRTIVARGQEILPSA